MKTYTIVAITLIAVGILALVYGQFSYTRDSESARLGPIVLTVKEKQSVNIPNWAGAGTIIMGVGMLAFPLIRR